MFWALAPRPLVSFCSDFRSAFPKSTPNIVEYWFAQYANHSREIDTVRWSRGEVRILFRPGTIEFSSSAVDVWALSHWRFCYHEASRVDRARIGRNGRTFTFMNKPLWRTIRAWMHLESGIIIGKTGDFGAAEWLKSSFRNIKRWFF